MTGESDSTLPSGEYWITPAVKMSDISVGDVLSGDLGFETEADGDWLHKYEVVRPDGTSIFDVYETHGSAEHDWFPFSIPQYVYLLVGPDSTPRLAVEVDQGWYSSYTIRDPQTEELLGTVAKSRRIIGDWQLTDSGGRARATANRASKSKKLFSSATFVTWEVSGQDGAKIAQFQRGPAEGSSSDKFPAMNISCSRSPVSTEQCLAFAFALLYEGTKSTIRSDHGP